MNNRIFKQIKQLSIFSLLFFATVILGTCKQYKADLKEYLSYWASQAFVLKADIKDVKTDSDGFLCVGSETDAQITLTLTNPKNFTLIMPTVSETRQIVSFSKLGGV